MDAEPEPWSHNIHYHPLVLEAVPAGAQRALDVGCGEGLLVRRLGERVGTAVGIDRHESSIGLARKAGGGVEYVLGDVLDHPFVPGSFDLVASVATLHHMDGAPGLERMRDLLRPGGVLVVVGLARVLSPIDGAYALGGVVATRWLRRSGTRSRTQAPSSVPIVWPPPETYGQARRTAERVLPGVRFRRHVLFRYSLTWTKPTS